MGKLNPVDNRLVKQIRETNQVIQQQASSNNTEIGDWTNRSVANYSVASSTSITLQNDEVEFFAKGSRLRVKQSGDSNYRYFYVTKVSGSTLTLNAGTEYSLNGGLSLEEIGFSNIIAPTGFPSEFDFDSNFASQNDVSNVDILRENFSIIGDKVFMNFLVEFDVDSSTGLMEIDLPVEHIDIPGLFSVTENYIYVVQNVDLAISWASVDPGTNRLYYYSLDGASPSWEVATGSDIAGPPYIYTYEVP